jgi:hypothetical protein
MNKLLTPPGSAERWADGIVVCFVGVACFLVYYLIEFDLCGKADCSDLVYMKFWANMAELFVLYGIAVLIVGIFLIRDNETIRIYRLGIVVAVIAGFVLSAAVVFGIGKELGGVT